MALTNNDKQSWLEPIWHALHAYREDCIAGSSYDAEWDDICTAMAWITEELGLKEM